MGLRENIRDFLTIVKYNLKIETRYPLSYFAGILSLFFWILSLAVFIILLSEQPANRILIGNLIVWGNVSYFIFGGFVAEVTYGFVRLQRRGTLEQILLAPVNEYILPLGLAGFGLIVRIFFIGFVILLFKFLLGIPIIINNVIMGLLALLLMLMMFYGFALLLSGVVIKTKRAGDAMANFIMYLFIIFCGAFYPFRALPEKVLAITRVIPLSYAVDLLRTSIVGINPELIPAEVAYGIGLKPIELEFTLVLIMSIISLIVGCYYYGQSIKRAKIEGTLATY